MSKLRYNYVITNPCVSWAGGYYMKHKLKTQVNSRASTNQTAGYDFRQIIAFSQINSPTVQMKEYSNNFPSVLLNKKCKIPKIL